MKFTILIISLLLISPFVSAELAVIVHPDNTSVIDKKNINRIFMGKIREFSDGSAIIPIIQSKEVTLTEEFNEKIIKKSAKQIKAYWAKALFTGKGTPPKEVDNDLAMIKLIASNPNLIGYIDSSNKTDDVKIIATF